MDRGLIPTFLGAIAGAAVAAAASWLAVLAVLNSGSTDGEEGLEAVLSSLLDGVIQAAAVLTLGVILVFVASPLGSYVALSMTKRPRAAETFGYTILLYLAALPATAVIARLTESERVGIVLTVATLTLSPLGGRLLAIRPALDD